VFLHPAVDARVATLHPALRGPALHAQVATDPATLSELAGCVAAAASLWHGAVTFAAAPRWSTRLVSTPAVEVNLLGWAAGQGTRAHDHGGAATALWVVEGELVEDSFSDPVWASPGSRRRLPTGTGVAFPPDRVHVVANPGPGVAVAVQVASPPALQPRLRCAGALSLFADRIG
jgi:hypothetical protein